MNALTKTVITAINVSKTSGYARLSHTLRRNSNWLALQINVFFQHLGEPPALDAGQHQATETRGQAAALGLDGRGQVRSGIQPIGHRPQHAGQTVAGQFAGQGPQSAAQRQSGLGQFGHPRSQFHRLLRGKLARRVETRPVEPRHRLLTSYG